MKLFRHYGRSYIYDKVHRAAVTAMIVLAGLSFFQICTVVVPVVKNNIGKPLPQANEESAAVKNKNPQ